MLRSCAASTPSIELADDRQRRFERHWALKRLAFDQLHDQIVRTDVVEVARVGVIQRGDSAGAERRGDLVGAERGSRRHRHGVLVDRK